MGLLSKRGYPYIIISINVILNYNMALYIFNPYYYVRMYNYTHKSLCYIIILWCCMAYYKPNLSNRSTVICNSVTKFHHAEVDEKCLRENYFYTLSSKLFRN